MHRIARQKRCTSIVQRKLTKVDCSDNWDNIFTCRGRPGPGRFLALTAAALVYFATIALRGTQPYYIRSESRTAGHRVTAYTALMHMQRAVKTFTHADRTKQPQFER